MLITIWRNGGWNIRRGLSGWWSGCRSPEPKYYHRKLRADRVLRDPYGTAPGPIPDPLATAPLPSGLLSSRPSILSSGRQACLATSGAEKAQLHKPNRRWLPGRLMGVSPDTRRTRAVDNFQTPGWASSLRRAS